MARIQTIITPRTAAVTTHVDVDTGWYSSVVFSTDALATTEEVDILVKVNGNYVPFLDAGGTAAKLTATNQSRELAGGVTYGIIKDTTAGACGVYMSFSKANKKR